MTLAAVAAVGACSSRRPDRRQVAASIFPLYDLARRVGGDRLRVELVLPPGHTTHQYDPSPKDVARLADASLVFGVGLGLDGWLGGLVKNAGGGLGRVYELGPLADPMLVPARFLPEPPPMGSQIRGEGPIDPHFWLDPMRMRRVVDLMVDAYRNLDPEGGPGYALRGDEVKASLLRLHTELEARKARWQGARIVTFHGSLFYFTERYGPEVVAVVEPVAGQEPTPRHLQEVAAAAREQKASALFSEPQLEAGPARVVAGEAGVPTYEIDPVGGLPATDTYEKLLLQIAAVFDRVLPPLSPPPPPSEAASPSPSPARKAP
jgi:ABC-type Zn uptake system ZnuABC Zn-binding protein ZnuA